MFLDGITYAVIARNMAIGIGTLWEPSFSSTIYAKFFEQPPLGMWLQSLAFALLGDHPAVERIFALAMLAANAALIVGLWRMFLPADYDWLPLVFWVLPSVVTWAAINNMLENTQAVFTSAAVYALVRTCRERVVTRTAAWSAVAAVAVVAAGLVKGPVGLFPLAVPLLFAVLPSSQRPPRLAVVVLVLSAVVGVCGGAILLDPRARQSLEAFASSHLVPALQGGRGVGPRAADILRHLALGIWARMGALVIVLWLVRRSAASVRAIPRAAYFFLSIGCAASLPILTSPVLAGHYFFPSVPFFALGFAALAMPAVSEMRAEPGGWPWRAPAALAIALLATIVVVLAVHGSLERRDVAMLRSLDAISAVAPRGTTVGGCAASGRDWGLLAYLQRYYRISLMPNDAPVSGWFVITPGSCAAPSTCQPAVEAEAFSLMRCTS